MSVIVLRPRAIVATRARRSRLAIPSRFFVGTLVAPSSCGVVYYDMQVSDRPPARCAVCMWRERCQMLASMRPPMRFVHSGGTASVHIYRLHMHGATPCPSSPTLSSLPPAQTNDTFAWFVDDLINYGGSLLSMCMRPSISLHGLACLKRLLFGSYLQLHVSFRGHQASVIMYESFICMSISKLHPVDSLRHGRHKGFAKPQQIVHHNTSRHVHAHMNDI